MGRLLALDYGQKRTGIAETDELQIIASGLTTVETRELFTFLKKYLGQNKVDALVVGMPVRMNGEASDVEQKISSFIQSFQKEFPSIPVEREEEMFTSKMAVQAMVAGGMKKKNRRVKGNIDRISATIILQRYMERTRFSL